jgi:hypothetical protein
MAGWVVASVMLPVWLIGLFVLAKVLFLPMKKPADTSNRIAHLTLVWEAINRPENFVKGQDRDYLSKDIF